MDMNASIVKACDTHTVLVVEDDALLALSIEDVLRNAGVSEVAVCPTVALAMEELEKKQPDAIILDVYLGDRNDGWALAEVIACITPIHPRIIFSTAAPEEIPPEIAKLGAIFEKPYDPAMLLDALSENRSGLFSRFRRALNNSVSQA